MDGTSEFDTYSAVKRGTVVVVLKRIMHGPSNAGLPVTTYPSFSFHIICSTRFFSCSANLLLPTFTLKNVSFFSLSLSHGFSSPLVIIMLGCSSLLFTIFTSLGLICFPAFPSLLSHWHTHTNDNSSSKKKETRILIKCYGGGGGTMFSVCKRKTSCEIS